MSTEKSHEDGYCLHCGGSVDEHGMAVGGEVADEEMQPSDIEETDESRQMADTERLRDFAKAVTGGR